ncbi:hypothetical protein M8J76_015489 [Diaphorina citri]|nr:hypothetical protein M8J75_001627 [Diaphorina citri]KAI5733754.1 hypothetical protein M8J76_015489 [Diaphorina citri]
MKPCLPLCCVLVAFLAGQSLAHSVPTAQSVTSSITQNTLLDDVDLVDVGTDDSSRVRRSGLTGLINKKLHFIGHLSGSSSGSSSHSSSHSGHHGHHDDHHHVYETEHHEYGLPHGFEHHEEHKSHKLYDYKKHILAALFQAVKAITGGVVALKGQVLKIGGHLITWKGKFLVKKGDQISDFGREVAAKALLSPVHHHHHHSPVVYSAPTSFGSSAYASAQASHSSSHAHDLTHHEAPHHYVAPSYSAPAPTYTSPSGGAAFPYPSAGVSDFDYGSNYGAKVTRAVSSSARGQGNSLSNDQLHAGLLILKPIQVPKDQQSKYQFAQQSLIKQAAMSGININTAGNTGINYNAGSYTPSQSTYDSAQSNSYNAPQPASYQGQTNNYQGQSTSYQGPSSYGTQAQSPATSQFVKIPSSFSGDYRNSFPVLAPTPLPSESSPFDFLYNKNSKSSQERQDSRPAETEQVNESALSALNVLYQQAEAQNKEQTRETRHTGEESLNDETLKKILDALFSGKDNKLAKSSSSDQENTDMASSASEHVEKRVLPPSSAERRSDDVVYPVFEVDYV